MPEAGFHVLFVVGLPFLVRIFFLAFLAGLVPLPFLPPFLLLVPHFLTRTLPRMPHEGARQVPLCPRGRFRILFFTRHPRSSLQVGAPLSIRAPGYRDTKHWVMAGSACDQDSEG